MQVDAMMQGALTSRPNNFVLIKGRVNFVKLMPQTEPGMFSLIFHQP